MLKGFQIETCSRSRRGVIVPWPRLPMPCLAHQYLCAFISNSSTHRDKTGKDTNDATIRRTPKAILGRVGASRNPSSDTSILR